MIGPIHGDSALAGRVASAAFTGRFRFLLSRLLNKIEEEKLGYPCKLNLSDEELMVTGNIAVYVRLFGTAKNLLKCVLKNVFSVLKIHFTKLRHRVIFPGRFELGVTYSWRIDTLFKIDFSSKVVFLGHLVVI